MHTNAKTEQMREPYGWVLGRVDENRKFTAHIASASPAGTRFIPLFPTKSAAKEYRDLRLEMRELKMCRVAIKWL
jgi:hypothetical protein